VHEKRQQEVKALVIRFATLPRIFPFFHSLPLISNIFFFLFIPHHTLSFDASYHHERPPSDSVVSYLVEGKSSPFSVKASPDDTVDDL